MVKNPPANAGDARDRGLIPGLGRSPAGGNGNPLQYSSLENPMGRGAWWATVHGVAKGWTQLKRLSTSASWSLGLINLTCLCFAPPQAPAPVSYRPSEPSSGRRGPWSLTPACRLPRPASTSRSAVPVVCGDPCNVTGPPSRPSSGTNAGRLRTVLARR